MNRTVKGMVAGGVITVLMLNGASIYNLNNKLDVATKELNRLEQKAEGQNTKINSLQDANGILKDTVNKLEVHNKGLLGENKKLKEQVTKAEAKVSEASKKKEMPSRGEPSKFLASYNIQATAYTAFCNTGCQGITATGKDVSNTIYHNGMRIIAVDPKLIPLNSIVMVKLADGTMFKAIALDTGGDIKGYRLDLLVDSTDKAWNFGRQEVTVKVIEWG